ncbi:acyl-CoA dehydrogenase family protein [bacterium]|nr:acyl-CoA dehydrogenase family protein [candidate division CSSED10-310 bacterium]
MSGIGFFDYLGLKSFLDEDESTVLETFMKFAVAASPVMDEYAWRREPAPGMWDRMAELGVFGAHVPETYGGTALPDVAYGLMMLGLEAADSSLRSAASVQNALVCYPIHRYGDEEQRRRYLPRLASGALIGAFGLTEPDHGSDPGGMTTTAVRHAGGYVLNGAKQWITNADRAGLFVIWARLEGEVNGFLVERGAPGLSTPALTSRDSLQAGYVGEIVMSAVEVGEESLLPNGRGLKCPLRCLNEARYGIAWGVLGAAMTLFNATREYTLTRAQFGNPLAAHQLVQWKLAEMATAITAGLSLVLHLGRLRERGKADFAHVSMAKKMNCQAARRVAMLARDLHGANGISSEYPVMRHWKNIESVFTYEGTDHMHGLIIGERLTGIPAYRTTLAP